MDDDLDFLGAALEYFDGPEDGNIKPEGDKEAAKDSLNTSGSLKDNVSDGPKLIDVGVDFLSKSEKKKLPKKVSSSENSKSGIKDSLVHNGDTDSSDDEQNKYFEESKYNPYGLTVKKLMKENDENFKSKQKVSGWTKPNNKSQFGLPESKVIKKEKIDVYTEPIFGIRIVNPTVSSEKIREKMENRMAVSFSKVQAHVAHGDLKSDWVLGGVIVQKSAPKVSQKGSTYLIWTLSDLKLGLKTVAVFLFGRTYEQLWKTPVGTVLGILNPNVLGNKDNNRDEATLSIFNPDQVMIWGKSKDLGQCKSKKKNGDPCGAFVNISQCEFCVYHVQSEYRKFSGRSELQSPTCGNINSANLRNKVLGKNEVFYGGKSFTAVPCKKSSRRDDKRLNHLGVNTLDIVSSQKSSPTSSPFGQRTNGIMGMLNGKRASSDKDRLAALGKTSTTKTVLAEKKEFKANCEQEVKPFLSDPGSDFNLEMNTPVTNSKSVLQKRFTNLTQISPSASAVKNSKLLLKHNSSPKTCTDNSKGFNKNLNDSNKRSDALKLNNSQSAHPDAIPLEHQSDKDEGPVKTSPSIQRTPTSFNANALPQKPKSSMSRAKLKALAYVKQNGSINKKEPQGGNSKGRGVKRFLENDPETKSDKATDDVNHNVLSQRFIELMKIETNHKDLVKLDEYEKEMEYYEKMEKKEQMQEKMMSTYAMECKLVRCMKCKYTWFSASDACKADQHPLKVFTGMKRFFRCNSCSNRTVAVTFLPLVPCSKCGETKWQRAPMMKEKLIRNGMELSIRGGEHKFVNSCGTNMNLNLMVPDS